MAAPDVARCEACRTCDHNYRAGLHQLIDTPGKVGLYDIDLVLEVDGRIRAIGEYKRFAVDYQEFLVPSFEYVALKKIAKLLKVPALLIVEIVGALGADPVYWCWLVDRFERRRKFVRKNDQVWAVFRREEAKLTGESRASLSSWLNGLVNQWRGRDG